MTRSIPTMRVLVLHSELGVLRGGGENVTRHLFPAFAARGHHVAAAFTADWRGRFPLPLPRAIEPLPVRGWWFRTLGQGALSSMSRHLARVPSCRPAVERIQESLGWRTFAWHKRRFRGRVERLFAGRWHEFDAVYVHGDVILASRVALHRPTLLRLPGPVAREYAPQLRTVHAVCANGDVLIRTRAFLGDHVVELPLGLDTRTFAPGLSDIRPRLAWDDAHCVIGYVGRLTRLKGIDLLAAAFREVVRDAPDARLLIVGSGVEEHYVRGVLAPECAAGLVHIERAVEHDQLPSWYRAMNLMVIPSRYENHSNALLEAMACGVPFLASDVGGNRKFAEAGGGWLVEGDSVPALTQSLHRLLRRRADLKASGDTGARLARDHQSWTASAERLESIIETRLGRR